MAVLAVLEKLFPWSDPAKTVASPSPLNRGSRVPMMDRLKGSLSAECAQNTVVLYMGTMRELIGVLKVTEESIGTISAEDAAYYVNWLKTRPAQKGRSSVRGDFISNCTIKKKLNSLATVYKHLRRLKLAEVNPFEDLQREYQKKGKGGDRRETQLIPFDKVKELLALPARTSQDKRDLAFLACLFGGALRLEEAVKLRVMDVKVMSEERVYLVLRNTKAQCSATQYVLRWGQKLIREYLEIRKSEGAKPTDAFLIPYRARENSGKPLTTAAGYQTFKRWMSYVGLDATYSPHCARATAITFLLDRGKHHRKVQNFSRHATLEMVVHYDKLRGADIADDFDDVDL